MKTLICILLSSFVLLPAMLFAQSPINGISYKYDAGGNRIKREPAPDIVERKANPNTGNLEQKASTVVSENNLKASFTPNPTFSGNFTVTVSRNDFSTISSIPSDIENPKIFIYNPLGELIQQKATQFDFRENISLTGLSKGIYLVKIQNKEEVLMHRMAYQ